MKELLFLPEYEGQDRKMYVSIPPSFSSNLECNPIIQKRRFSIYDIVHRAKSVEAQHIFGHVTPFLRFMQQKEKSDLLHMKRAFRLKQAGRRLLMLFRVKYKMRSLLANTSDLFGNAITERSLFLWCEQSRKFYAFNPGELLMHCHRKLYHSSLMIPEPKMITNPYTNIPLTLGMNIAVTQYLSQPSNISFLPGWFLRWKSCFYNLEQWMYVQRFELDRHSIIQYYEDEFEPEDLKTEFVYMDRQLCVRGLEKEVLLAMFNEEKGSTIMTTLIYVLCLSRLYEYYEEMTNHGYVSPVVSKYMSKCVSQMLECTEKFVRMWNQQDPVTFKRATGFRLNKIFWDRPQFIAGTHHME